MKNLHWVSFIREAQVNGGTCGFRSSEEILMNQNRDWSKSKEYHMYIQVYKSCYRIPRVLSLLGLRGYILE